MSQEKSLGSVDSERHQTKFAFLRKSSGKPYGPPMTKIIFLYEGEAVHAFNCLDKSIELHCFPRSSRAMISVCLSKSLISRDSKSPSFQMTDSIPKYGLSRFKYSDATSVIPGWRHFPILTISILTL